MKVLRQFRSLLRKEQRDAEMTEEMRGHLEMQAERNRAAGMDATEADYAAQRQFGNVASLQEQARAARPGVGLELLVRDVAFALRSLRRNAGFAATVMVSLVLGIGAATAVYSVVHAVLLAPLAYGRQGELVQIQTRHVRDGASDLAPATFGDIASGASSFDAVAAQYYFYLNLTKTAMPTLVNSADVTGDFFRVFQVSPWRGRALVPADFAKNATPVVVLGHAFWRGQFGGDESLVGRQILLDDVAHEVVGIMPPGFTDPAGTAQLWRPMRPGADDLTSRSSRYWTGFGRCKPGVTLEQANAELATIGRQLARAYPANYENWTLEALDLRTRLVGDYRRGLWTLLAAVGCLVAITCANVTGLSMVRTASRGRELAVRAALGSSRGRLIRLLVVESLVPAVLGGLGGVLLAQWGVAALLAGLPSGWLPRAGEISLNWAVLGVSAALAGACGLAAGMVPGWLAARVELTEALKDGARGSGGLRGTRLRGWLVGAEIGLAVVLLSGAGLLARSFARLAERPAGIDAQHLLSLTVSHSGKRYDEPAKSWAYFSRAEAAVAALPGVEAAGFTHTSPFRWGIPIGYSRVGAAGAGTKPEAVQAFTDSVSVDFFKAAGIPLRAGRLFGPGDDHTARRMLIISESAARRYFGREDPIGRQLSSGGPQPFEVVGVVGDVRRSGLVADAPLQVYRPLAQRTPSFATLMVRTSLPPAALAKPVQAALLEIDPDTPVTDIVAMDEVVGRSIAQPRLHFLLFGVFAAMAVLLAGVGLYGLVAYSVGQRTQEFGIRLALGASPGRLSKQVLREGGRLVAWGAAAGLAVTLLAVRLLENLVYDVSLYDPLILGAVIAVLAGVAGLACWLPARRAAQVDPVVALRAE
jgi:putative ABC transport system permease protein